MREKRNLKIIGLFLCILACLFSIYRMDTDVLAETTYPFEKYYDPEEDEWANAERVNMDGELDFTIPDMQVQSMDVIVYGTNDPKIQTLTNEKGKKIDFTKKHGDNSTYTYYTVSDVDSGDWKLQLREGSWESTSIYLIYHSAYTAKYTIEPELKNPDSGNYQALIRLYDENDKELTLKNRKVSYLIDDRSLMSETTKDEKYHCYLGQAGLDQDDMDLLGDDYSCHIIVTSDDGTIVLTEAERADKKEFKEIKSAYTPSLWNRFRAKPEEEQKMILMTAGCILIFLILLILILKKTRVLKRRDEKVKKAKEERYQDAIRSIRKQQDDWEKCKRYKQEILTIQEELEPYEIWVESSISKKTRRNLSKLTSDQVFSILQNMQERSRTVKERWEEIRQKGKKLSDAKEKELIDHIREQGSLVETITGKLADYHGQYVSLKREIEEYEDRKMFYDLHVRVWDGRNEYSGIMEALELGMPRKRGIQDLNQIKLRGSRRILLDDLDLGGLLLAVGFTENDKRQKMVLISNRELYCEDEDMEMLRRETPCTFGPYQYMDFEGLGLYTADRKELLFYISRQ